MSGAPAKRRVIDPVDIGRYLMLDASCPSGLRYRHDMPRYKHARPGKPAGALGRGGPGGARRQWMVSVRARHFVAARVIWALLHGVDPGLGVIDHIDSNPVNNAIGNLRRVTPRENLQNAVSRAGVSSAFKGVSLRCGVKRMYRAQIRAAGVARYIGTFPTEREAAAAYNAAALEHFGASARLNDLDNPGETYAATEVGR